MLLSLTQVSSPSTSTSHNPNKGAAILRRGGGLEHPHLSLLSNETLEVFGVAEIFFFKKKKVYIFLIFNF